MITSPVEGIFLKGNVPVHSDQEGKEGHLVEASKSARVTQAHEKSKVAIPHDLEIHQIQHDHCSLDNFLLKLLPSLYLGESQSEQEAEVRILLMKLKKKLKFSTVVFLSFLAHCPSENIKINVND